MVNIRTDILGVGFDNITMNEAVSKALELMQNKSAAYVVTPNPEIVMQCRDNEALKDAIKDAALVLPDGIGIVKGANILGTPMKEKIPGIDFAANLFSEMAKNGQSVFLFGAKPGVAEDAAKFLIEKYSGLVISGTNDGYFSNNKPIIDKINSANPDLLLVCLGAPKQELWMQENADKLNVGLMAGLGGSLDVFAGVAERAPESWQKLGLEWLYRLIKEPSRIGRMSNLPKFVFAVFGKRIRG